MRSAIHVSKTFSVVVKGKFPKKTLQGSTYRFVPTRPAVLTRCEWSDAILESAPNLRTTGSFRRCCCCDFLLAVLPSLFPENAGWEKAGCENLEEHKTNEDVCVSEACLLASTAFWLWFNDGRWSERSDFWGSTQPIETSIKTSKKSNARTWLLFELILLFVKKKKKKWSHLAKQEIKKVSNVGRQCTCSIFFRFDSVVGCNYRRYCDAMMGVVLTSSGGATTIGTGDGRA